MGAYVPATPDVRSSCGRAAFTYLEHAFPPLQPHTRLRFQILDAAAAAVCFHLMTHSLHPAWSAESHCKRVNAPWILEGISEHSSLHLLGKLHALHFSPADSRDPVMAVNWFFQHLAHHNRFTGAQCTLDGKTGPCKESSSVLTTESRMVSHEDVKATGSMTGLILMLCRATMLMAKAIERSGRQYAQSDSRSTHVALSTLAAVTAGVSKVAFTHAGGCHAPPVLAAWDAICRVCRAGLEDKRAISSTACSPHKAINSRKREGTSLHELTSQEKCFRSIQATSDQIGRAHV